MSQTREPVYFAVQSTLTRASGQARQMQAFSGLSAISNVFGATGTVSHYGRLYPRRDMEDFESAPWTELRSRRVGNFQRAVGLPARNLEDQCTAGTIQRPKIGNHS